MKKFKTFHNNDFDFDSLALDSNCIEECIQEMQRTSTKSVHINAAFGWKEGSSIDFLLDYPWIEGVEILENNVDIAVLNYLPNLKWLRLVGRSVKGQIDFDNCKNLLSFEAFWQKSHFINFTRCADLQYVWIGHYPWTSLTILSGFQNLQKLELSYGKLQALDGVSSLKSLKDLTLYSFPNLSSISDLKDCTSLKELMIEKCKKIEDYKALKELRQLQALVLMESAPIDTVGFLERFENLRYAYIGLEILDKNVHVLKDKAIEFKRSKYYR